MTDRWTDGRTEAIAISPSPFFKKKRGDNKGRDQIVQLVLNFRRVLNI